MTEAKKLYIVTLELTSVVLAESEADAFLVARHESAEMISDDDGGDEWEVGREISSLDDLPGNWSGECLPYSCDDNRATLAELLQKTPVADAKIDDRTIDMFTGKALADD